MSTYPDLINDSVNVPLDTPGLGAMVYAIPESEWSAYFNDNDPAFGDFDFNDWRVGLEFDGSGGLTLTYEGSLSAWVNHGGHGAAQVSAANPTAFVSGFSSWQEVILSMTNPGGQTWFTGPAARNSSGHYQAIVQRVDLDTPVATPEPATSALLVAGLVIVVAARRLRGIFA